MHTGYGWCMNTNEDHSAEKNARCECVRWREPREGINGGYFTCGGRLDGAGSCRKCGSLRVSSPATERCDEGCHVRNEDTCPKCDTWEWALMCDSCRSYAVQDGEPVTSPGVER